MTDSFSYCVVSVIFFLLFLPQKDRKWLFIPSDFAFSDLEIGIFEIHLVLLANLRSHTVTGDKKYSTCESELTYLY